MRHTILYIQGVTINGGSHQSLLGILSKLDRGAFSPQVLTSGEGPLTQELKAMGVRYHIIPMGMWRKGKTLPRLPFTLYDIYRLMQRERISLVHGNTIWDNPYGAIPAGWLKIPSVCHLRSEVRSDMIRKYRLGRTGKLIAASEVIRRSVGEWGKERTVTIYNGVSLDISGVAEAGRRRRSELGFAPEHVVAGMTSRLDPLKGQEVFIRAAAKVITKYPQARFLIVGETSERQQDYLRHLKSLVQTLNLSPYVVFAGHQKNIMEYTAAMDISALPSFSEGFGRTNLEAMALSKPVISTNLGGIPEVVEDGVTGYLVPVDDAEALAQKIADLAGDERKRHEMGKAGRRRAEEKFNLAEQVKKIERVYECLIG